MFVTISKNTTVSGAASQLPSSKSISNRALILNALSGFQSVVSNLSSARDTKLMQALVGSADKVIDVMDAGTTMRFLTAYFAITDKNKVLTGTPRMKERPIGLLVDALRSLGATISYVEKEGFPPIAVKGFSGQQATTVSLPGNVSSQYISALMMVAPVLPRGLTIRIEGEIGSRPYIDMTSALMKAFGVVCEIEGHYIHVPHASYKISNVTVEADWSAASYWFAFTALAVNATVRLPNVSKTSVQGDKAIVDIMDKLGVLATFESGSAVLTKKHHNEKVSWDFKDCPDLAQTVLPVCAAKGITGSFTGMESLRIKETDRIAALQKELAKFGTSLHEDRPGAWKLLPGTITTPLEFDTYHDHRMAMGLAPLATLTDLKINAPEVVNKSYPGFWDDMRSTGFNVVNRDH